MKRFICLLLSALMLTACTPTPDDTPSEDPPVQTQFVVQDLDPSASYVTGNYAKVEGATIQQYPRLTNLPTLYIDLDDGLSLGDVQHGIYSTATYTFVDCYLETSYYELPLSIKGRGNYSWSFAQKPYTIKLDDAADFLGMGSDSKWVLITLSSDKSMMHNYLTQKLAAAMGLEGTVENEYIDVVVNGEYSGTYVLTESIEIDESRLDIPKDTGMLFEIQMKYRHECVVCAEMYQNYRDDSHSVHLELKEYKGQEIDEMTNVAKNQAQREIDFFFSAVEEAMKGGDFEALSEIIDVDSFVNWFLLNEFTKNYDSRFVSSVYCYVNYSKLYMGPCWDYDTCYGIQFPEPEGSFILEESPWYQWLFDYSPEFVEKVNERWTELREEGGLIDQFIASIDTTVEYIAMSEKLQHNLYPHSELTDIPFEDAVEYLKNWIDARIEWMDWEYMLY